MAEPRRIETLHQSGFSEGARNERIARLGRNRNLDWGGNPYDTYLPGIGRVREREKDAMEDARKAARLHRGAIIDKPRTIDVGLPDGTTRRYGVIEVSWEEDETDYTKQILFRKKTP